MSRTNAATHDSVKLGPGTAGVVQRIHIAAVPVPHLKVMKPVAEQTCDINQY